MWNWQNTRVDYQKILLINPSLQRWNLREELWHLSSLQGGLPKALWWPVVVPSFYTLTEKSHNRFCHRVTDFYQLETWELWLDPYYHWSPRSFKILVAAALHGIYIFIISLLLYPSLSDESSLKGHTPIYIASKQI